MKTSISQKVWATFKGQIVSVVSVFRDGAGRKLVEIQAEEGQKYQHYTHGGWCESDTKITSADLLRPVEECSCTPLTVTACDACRLAIRLSDSYKE